MAGIVGGQESLLLGSPLRPSGVADRRVPDELSGMLAKAWREHGDTDAAHRLVSSHLRLVAKIAMGYRGYGLPLSELISEGNVGMMQAVKRFEKPR